MIAKLLYYIVAISDMSDLTQSEILEECRVKLVRSVESQTG